VEGRPNSWVKDWTTTPEDWNNFFLELASTSMPEAKLAGSEQCTFDYRYDYLPADMKESANITLTMDDAIHLRPENIPGSDSFLVRALLKSRELAATNVWAGRLMMKVPNPIKQIIKRKLANR
jgi:hypothetical protein